MATLAFIATRIAPPLGFGFSMAGGVALARAGGRFGARCGYGAALAALLETASLVGPQRLGGPISQAITAPAIGRMQEHGRPHWRQVAVCLLIRFLYQGATTAILIFVVVGGLDAYAGTYDNILGRIPGVPDGPIPALVLTYLAVLGWGLFAAIVQVKTFARAMRHWPERAPDVEQRGAVEPPPHEARPFDPRAVALGGVIGLGLALASTSWAVLGALAAWLALVWALGRPQREVVPTGLVLAGLLAAGALAFGLIGGVGVAEAGSRALRAALLVLLMTWLRGTAGAAGFREVLRRVMGRLRLVPCVGEASGILDELGHGRRLGSAVRELVGSVRGADRKPLAFVDSVLRWIAQEADRFRAHRALPLELRLRARDALLALSAALPALAFLVR